MINEGIIDELIQSNDLQKVVATTKYVDAETIRELYHLGIRTVGENRVEAFLPKYESLTDLDIEWHFIGHLQSKKVKHMINKIEFLHSLDRLSLAEQIQKHRVTPLKCFIEVNISNEESKHGLPVKEVYSFCDKLKNYDKIQVVGLMGMAEYTDDKTVIRQQFQKLVDLKEALKLAYLSMGMTNDYKIALEMGSTHLRLGRILFK